MMSRTQAEGLLKAPEVTRQRLSIKAAQVAVLDRLLAGTAAKAHARFDTIPFFAAEVDANAMARQRALTERIWRLKQDAGITVRL